MSLQEMASGVGSCAPFFLSQRILLPLGRELLPFLQLARVKK